MNRLIGSLLFILAFPGFVRAQAVEATISMPRQQVAVLGSGIFTRKITDAGVTYKPTSSGGGSFAYRFNINRWLGVEADYDFFRNSQKYLTSNSSYELRTNLHAASGAVVINLPNPLTKRMKSYFLAGGGGLMFHPRDTELIDPQFKPAIVFGGGVDIPVSRHLAIRGQAKTFLYKAPDFKVESIRTNKYAQGMVPSVGLVYSF